MTLIYRNSVDVVNRISVYRACDIPSMGDSNDRLKEVRIKAGFTSARSAAIRFGWNPSTYASHENGQTPVPQKAAAKYAPKFKTTPGWILTGESPVDHDLVVTAPILSWVSAGKLTDLRSIHRLEEIEDAPKFRVVGLKPSNWIALKVSGSSMDRISPPDSIILVDCKDKRLVANACYVIEDIGSGEATYKRYRPDPMRFEPVTFSEGHETLYPDQEPKIIGRVKRTILDL